MCGWSFMNRSINGGRMSTITVSVTFSFIEPRSSPQDLVALCNAAPTSLNSGERRSASACPASVGVTLRVARISRGTPSRASSCATFSLTEDGGTKIAEAIGAAVGKPVSARAIPRNEWNGVLAHMGLTPAQSLNWEEMQDGFNSGWIDFGKPGAESVPGTTPPATVYAEAFKRQRLAKRQRRHLR